LLTRKAQAILTRKTTVSKIEGVNVLTVSVAQYSMTDDEYNTKSEVVDIHFDKIVSDNWSRFTDWVKGSSSIDNWKLVGVFGSGVVHPTLPYTLALVYVVYKSFTDGLVQLDEGVHYETEERKYKVAEEE